MGRAGLHRHTPDRILRGHAPVSLRLAELRRAAGLSQERLAFRVGVRQATISDRQAYLKGWSDDL